MYQSGTQAAIRDLNRKYGIGNLAKSNRNRSREGNHSRRTRKPLKMNGALAQLAKQNGRKKSKQTRANTGMNGANAGLNGYNKLASRRQSGAGNVNNNGLGTGMQNGTANGSPLMAETGTGNQAGVASNPNASSNRILGAGMNTNGSGNGQMNPAGANSGATGATNSDMTAGTASNSQNGTHANADFTDNANGSGNVASTNEASSNGQSNSQDNQNGQGNTLPQTGEKGLNPAYLAGIIAGLAGLGGAVMLHDKDDVKTNSKIYNS